MDRRRDALVAASLFVPAAADLEPPLVATVGKLSVRPGAANVIPGEVTLSLDVRSPDDAQRRDACERLLAAAKDAGRRRNVEVGVAAVSERAAVACSSRITALLREAVGRDAVEIASGAGHDGVYMSEIADIAMLFVRCKAGISHNPAESVTAGDVAVAIDVLGRFLDLLAQE
jgi:acetylornithine deacetylase/succinyl-diaminopimelate desuccinylase-like protein